MKKVKGLWVKSAQYDLENIIEYIKLDDINTAHDVFVQIRLECNELYCFPEKFRIVPELQTININRYREVVYKRWRIVYKIVDSNVYILFVIDSSRNVEDVLLQRLLK